MPSVKTDLQALNPGKDVMVWFGHSSYFLQIDGKKILVDPVLSGSASPVKFTFFFHLFVRNKKNVQTKPLHLYQDLMPVNLF